MLPEPHYVREALQRNLLVKTPLSTVFWTPSLARKLSSKPKSPPKYDRGDFFVGTYETLKHLRVFADSLSPGVWGGSEIHHIVEHQHLNLLGAAHPFSEQTYNHEEPCVVLSEKEHDSVINNAIGDAIKMVLTGERGFDVVTHWRESHPGLSKLDWNKKGLLVAKWLSDEENKSDPMFTRTLIHDMLIEAYAFAYREPFLHPLRSIALSVIKGVSL
jgi:hypothetical protein